MTKGQKAAGWCAVICATGLVIAIGGIWDKAHEKDKFGYGYVQSQVCKDAWEWDQSGELDHSQKVEDHFDIELYPGCFSGWVKVPRYWENWRTQFMSDEPDRHVGIWFFGWNSSQGPFAPGRFPDYPYPPSNRWRLQGVGKLRYYQTK